MSRYLIALCLVSSAVLAVAQTKGNSDPAAITLAAKSLAAMTAGNSVTDIVLNANAISVLGSEYETGSATLQVKGVDESRIDLNLNNKMRTEIRMSSNGIPEGKWKSQDSGVVSIAQHNTWADAAWFAPILSSLSQTSNPAYTFLYIGQAQKNGLPAEHLRVLHNIPGDNEAGALTRLSSVDFYLDAASLLPLALDFRVHPDNDVNTDILAEVLFAKYQTAGGVTLPFHIQRLLNGTVVLDVVVTDAKVNTGLSDTQFNLQ